MKRLISWLLALTMIMSLPLSAFAVEIDDGNGSWDEDVDFGELVEPEAGSDAEHPIDLTVDLLHEEDFTATVTVPAGKTVYYCAYRIGGMTMTINGGEGTICGGNMMMPHTWSITNDSDADAEYVIVVTLPLGTIDNPATLVLGENVATVAAGAQGYFYTYTAEKDGILVLEFATDAAGWTYAVNNLTTYAYGDTQWSDSDPVVNPAEVEVAAGDELQIMVCTYDAANPWAAPAGTVTVNASYKAAEEPAPEYVVDVGTFTLSLDAEVILQFKCFVPAELANDANAYAKLTIAGNEKTVLLSEVEIDGNGRHVFGQGIASGYMTKDVTLEIFDGNDNKAKFTYKGAEYGESFTASVIDYANTVYGQTNPAFDKVKVALDALLTYGGYAQQYFIKTNPKVDAEPVYNILAENGRNVGDISSISADDIDQVKTMTGDAIGIEYKTATVGLESAVYMTMKFQLNGSDTIDNYSFKLTLPTGSIDVTPVLEESSGRYVINIENIPAAYWDYMYTVTVTNKTTGGVYNASMSVMAYAKAMLGVTKDATLINLLKSMYFYNQAANTYFGK